MFKHVLHFRPPSAVKGKAVKRSRLKSPRRTEADSAVTVRRHTPETVGRADERRLSFERAATQHTAFEVINTINILFVFLCPPALVGWIPLEPLLAPCIHIPLHVEQAEIVGLQPPHRPRLLPRVLKVPRILRQQLFRFAKVPARQRPRARRILHLRSRRQPIPR